MSNIRVNFGDILPETSKSSAFWDMGVDSHLKWLLLFSPLGPMKRASWDGTNLVVPTTAYNDIVNVDIFACINFRDFMKMGNFACIKIHVLCIIGSLG